MAYVGPMALVCAALVLRFLLQPVFGAHHAYTTFYPAVVLGAYLFGPWAAILITAISSVGAYWFFVLPFAGAEGPQADLASSLFFMANCGVAIYLVSTLTRALRRLAANQERADSVAYAHAELFRDLNERVGDHFQLVASVLTLQGKGEPERHVADALARAADTSMLLARSHRQLSGRQDVEIDFVPFATLLVKAALTERQAPLDRILIDAADLRLPLEQATSLAVALLECTNALVDMKLNSPVRVSLSHGETRTVLRLAEVDEMAGVSIITPSSGRLLRAAVEQLGGRIWIVKEPAGSTLEVSFPHSPAALSPASDGIVLH
ncbi:DUF4118 domain-containing protein [Phenylobacterium hankyongense]|uniref:DUF4118 domain-containing protein n=1 Tax=Phenylobacterium hankyongense TaxID=1813876 RepID=UPI001A9DF637|nr:DUF4118 domain-containing protein [Phenylobacterium hankyongense]